VTLHVRVSSDRHGVRIRAHVQQGGFTWLIVNASPTRREQLWRGLLHGLEAMAIGNEWLLRMTGGIGGQPIRQHAG
jgi:hypothetical protein